jgi:hypothetical protein
MRNALPSIIKVGSNCALVSIAVLYYIRTYWSHGFDFSEDVTSWCPPRAVICVRVVCRGPSCRWEMSKFSIEIKTGFMQVFCKICSDR